MLAPSPSYTELMRQLIDAIDRARPHIEAALEYAGGTHTFDDVCNMIVTGRVRFWPLENSVMITEVVDFPRERHYHMWLGGGDLEEILAMHPQVLQAARDANCSKLSVSGRRGWVKPLQKHGWYEAHTTMHKNVEDEDGEQ